MFERLKNLLSTGSRNVPNELVIWLMTLLVYIMEMTVSFSWILSYSEDK